MSCIRYRRNEYVVRCMIKYKYVIIGYFKTKEEAEIAYDKYIIDNNLNRKLKRG